MTWLITGGTGQLGIALAQELSRRDLPFSSVGSKDLDVTNGSALHNFVGKLAPTVIVNCAGWTDVDGAEAHEELAARVNSDGAANVAFAAKSCGAKLIHISTDYVFSGQSQHPYGVNTAKNPQSAYGRTKADGEDRILGEYSQDTWIIRTAWLFSPWGKNFAKTMTRFALCGEGEVRVVDDQSGQPTSAADLTNQVVSLALAQAPAGIYHATNGGEATWFDFASEIFKCVGVDVKRLVPIATHVYGQRAIRPTYSVLNHDMWNKTTLPPMRDWRQALKEAMPEIITSIKTLG